MKSDWNGDSFDLVKRFWQDTLTPIAPLYSHQRFFRRNYIGRQDQQNYERLTKTTIIGSPPPSPFAWLLDPDTGICELGSATDKRVSVTVAKASPEHATLAFVVDLFRPGQDNVPKFVAVFDQSKPRRKGLAPYEHRMEKINAFKASSIGARLFYFYYISHAPFLFCSDDVSILTRVRETILASGVPERIPNGARGLEVRVTAII